MNLANSVIERAKADSNARWGRVKNSCLILEIEEYKEEGELSDYQAAVWYEAFMKEK